MHMYPCTTVVATVQSRRKWRRRQKKKKKTLMLKRLFLKSIIAISLPRVESPNVNEFFFHGTHSEISDRICVLISNIFLWFLVFTFSQDTADMNGESSLRNIICPKKSLFSSKTTHKEYTILCRLSFHGYCFYDMLIIILFIIVDIQRVNVLGMNRCMKW